MSLRHGLIGLLAREGPLTGYELTKAFDRSVNYVWHALPGQIYPELARLVKAGFIRQTGIGHRRVSPARRPFFMTLHKGSIVRCLL